MLLETKDDQVVARTFTFQTPDEAVDFFNLLPAPAELAEVLLG